MNLSLLQPAVRLCLLLVLCGAALSPVRAESRLTSVLGPAAKPAVAGVLPPRASTPLGTHPQSAVVSVGSSKPRGVTTADWSAPEATTQLVEPAGTAVVERGRHAASNPQSAQVAADWPPLAPAVTSVSQAVAAEAKDEPEKKDPPPEPKKDKAWYEKYKLRGYAQFRMNHTTHHEDGTATAQSAGDSSIGARESFLIRRARLIFQADVSDHLFIYLQPDFASNVPGSTDANEFVQIRDWYGDVYLDEDKVNRFRVGQSKVPFGWENLQSSSVRAPFDRNDAFNSSNRNERDLGVFYYWTPVAAQELFEKLSEDGLKPSGNYGIFGIGVFNGQGGSFREENDNVHLAARVTWPWAFANDQIIETSLQGYTGEYVVLGSAIRPLGLGAVDVTPLGTRERGQVDGHLDQRIGGSFVWYPKPLGFQAEWLVGRGPELNNAQTAIERDFLQGGYAMLLYHIDSECGDWFPYARWQFFEGGYRSFRNAPHAEVAELELGVEWQIRKEMELTLAYTWADRTNLDSISSSAAVSQKSYREFEGQLLRAQFQINY